MPAVTTRASKAVLKARAARDLRNIDGDAAVFRIEEAERRRMVAKEATASQKLAKPDSLEKTKVVFYKESKYFVRE